MIFTPKITNRFRQLITWWMQIDEIGKVSLEHRRKTSHASHKAKTELLKRIQRSVFVGPKLTTDLDQNSNL